MDTAHHYYETSDGHQWCLPNDVIRHDYCQRCLIIRRRDRMNTPCKGPGRLELRDPLALRATPALIDATNPEE